MDNNEKRPEPAVNAAVLIDWENFFLGREKNLYGEIDANEESQRLVRLSSKLIHEHNPFARVTVWRSYADYNATRPAPEGSRHPYDYYLQRTPSPLMRAGIEPVQVFRFPGGSNKNAADIRLVVDALRLRSDETGIDVFVIVSGDSDFIPLAIDLRRLGAQVLAIGVQGQTKEVLKKYVDRFEFYEDLVAAARLEPATGSKLDAIARALGEILNEKKVVPFKAVHPLLNARLGGAFDPEDFGAGNTGDFLRSHARELNVSIAKAEHDWNVGLPGIDMGAVIATTKSVASIGPSIASYRSLLRGPFPRLFEQSPERWRAIAPLVIRFGDPATRPGEFTPGNLIESITSIFGRDDEFAENAAKAAVVQLTASGIVLNAGTGTVLEKPTSQDKHTVLEFAEAHRNSSAEDIARAVMAFIMQTLVARAAAHSGGPVPVEPTLVAELLLGGEQDPNILPFVESTLREL